MNGKNEAEMVVNDMAMEAVESLLGKYLVLIYQDQLVSCLAALFCPKGKKLKT